MVVFIDYRLFHVNDDIIVTQWSDKSEKFFWFQINNKKSYVFKNPFYRIYREH